MKPSRQLPKILGHASTNVIRWMGSRGWTKEDAIRVLDHYESRPSDTAVYLCLNYYTKGKIASLTKTQAGVLEAIRDGKTPPTLPDSNSLASKIEVAAQDAITLALTARDLSQAINRRVVLEAYLAFAERLTDTMKEGLDEWTKKWTSA